MSPLAPLFSALAGMFSSEKRPGGDLAARHLLMATVKELPDVAAPIASLEDVLAHALADSQHPVTPLIDAAKPYLAWQCSDLDGRIHDEISVGMMQCELIGPDGLIHADDVRVGLWLQSPGIDYTTRTHAAEETFFILSGNAIWQSGDDAPHEENPGAQIHHPSMTPHQSRTTDSPLLVAWRWSGNISFSDYELK